MFQDRFLTEAASIVGALTYLGISETTTTVQALQTLTMLQPGSPDIHEAKLECCHSALIGRLS